MKTLSVIALLAFLLPAFAGAADKPAPSNPDDAWAAAKSAEIETMRVRLGTSPSANSMATLFETEDLLRRFRTSPAAQKAAMRSQVDAAMARLEMEFATQGR
jgi:hypothetical protein